MTAPRCTVCLCAGHSASSCPVFKGLFSLTDGFRLAVRLGIITGCWYWRGARDAKTGEPRCQHTGVRAALVAWEAANGPLPAGRSLVSVCGDDDCVNPAHHRCEEQYPCRL